MEERNWQTSLKQFLALVIHLLTLLGGLVLCLLLGVFIGYVFLGKGHFWEVFNSDTWRHIIDFIQT